MLFAKPTTYLLQYTKYLQKKNVDRTQFLHDSHKDWAVLFPDVIWVNELFMERSQPKWENWYLQQ